MTFADVMALVGRILPVILVLGVIGYFQWRKVKRRWDTIQKNKADGTIGPSRLLQGEKLPAQYDLLASLGTKGPAPVSLNEHILKPSIGVRLFVLGLAGLIGVFLFQPSLAPQGFYEAVPGGNVLAMQFLFLFAVLNSLLYIFGYETRYDRDVLIVTRMFFFRREFQWKNLWRIGDDEAYELHLFFEPGGKAKVLKHSTGIGDFKAFAVAQIQKNRAKHA